jgi:hypothetical protein
MVCIVELCKFESGTLEGGNDETGIVELDIIGNGCGKADCVPSLGEYGGGCGAISS